MNKKAQFYIITAVVLLVMTYGFFSPKLKYETDSTFRGLYENYLKEAPFAANTGNLEDFTRKFVEYGNTKEPNFGIAYLYIQSGDMTALNMIKKTIYINDRQLEFNNSLVAEKENSTTITFNGNQYVLNTSDSPQVKALFYSESGNSKKVYTNG